MVTVPSAVMLGLCFGLQLFLLPSLKNNKVQCEEELEQDFGHVRCLENNLSICCLLGLLEVTATASGSDSSPDAVTSPEMRSVPSCKSH